MGEALKRIAIAFKAAQVPQCFLITYHVHLVDCRLRVEIHVGKKVGIKFSDMFVIDFELVNSISTRVIHRSLYIS
jgi:hypothetical protein